MNILKRLFHKDIDTIQTTFNEDSEGIGGEVENVISSTEETTNKGE